MSDSWDDQSLWDWLSSSLFEKSNQKQERIIIRPRSPIVVRPKPRPYWDECGWSIKIDKNGSLYYLGNYCIVDKHKSQEFVFNGMVAFDGQTATPYILNPPQALTDHKDWKCFNRDTGDWFRLHWEKPTTDVDTAILWMEKILGEALSTH